MWATGARRACECAWVRVAAPPAHPALNTHLPVRGMICLACRQRPWAAADKVDMAFPCATQVRCRPPPASPLCMPLPPLQTQPAELACAPCSSFRTSWTSRTPRRSSRRGASMCSRAPTCPPPQARVSGGRSVGGGGARMVRLAALPPHHPHHHACRPRVPAVAYFHENGVKFGAAKAANAGGVAVSGLEMSQNRRALVRLAVVALGGRRGCSTAA